MWTIYIREISGTIWHSTTFVYKLQSSVYVSQFVYSSFMHIRWESKKEAKGSNFDKYKSHFAKWVFLANTIS